MKIFLLFLLSAKLTFSKTKAKILSQSYDRLSFQEATGNYLDSHYLDSHSVSPSSYSSSGDLGGHDIKLAFQDDKNYWVARDPSTDEFHSSIDISFSEPTLLEAFIYGTSYNTISKDDNTRHYDGFPTKFKVYIALNDDDDFTLNTIFSGIPAYPLEKAQFVFKNPVNCKRIRFEFIDVTEDTVFSNGKRCTNIRFLQFIKYLNYDDLVYSTPSGNYDNSVYTNFHQIPVSQFEYSSSGDENTETYPIKNAFDNNDNNYWVANTESGDSSTSHIIVNFKKPTLFEGFILKGRHYNEYEFPLFKDFYPGMPTRLNLYISNSTNNNDFVHKAIFTGSPSNKKDTYQFILLQKVLCNSIKIEFVDVNLDKKFTGSKKAVVNQI